MMTRVADPDLGLMDESGSGSGLTARLDPDLAYFSKDGSRAGFFSLRSDPGHLEPDMLL